MTEIEQVEDVKQEEKQEPKNLEDILKRHFESQKVRSIVITFLLSSILHRLVTLR